MTKASLPSISKICKKHKIKLVETNKLWWGKYKHRIHFKYKLPSILELVKSPVEKFEYENYHQLMNQLKIDHNAKIRHERTFHQLYFEDYMDCYRALRKLQNSKFKTLNINECSILPEGKEIDYERGVQFCNHFPFKKYKYKVFLSNKIRLEDRRGQKFVEWIEKYDGPYKLTHGTRYNLLNSRWVWSGHYMYVENDKYLSLLILKSSDMIQRVVEFKVKESKNE